MSDELSQAELDQRVAVLKRFRELLKEQRSRFASYLDMLDRSKSVLENGTADELIRHIELEERILGDIHSIQKVIDPLENMYKSLYGGYYGENRLLPGSIPTAPNDDIPGLKSALASLGREAAIRSQRNREILSFRMTELRQEIKNLRSNPYFAKRNMAKTAAPSLVDIRG